MNRNASPIRYDVDLSDCNTFGLPARARAFARIDSATQLRKALAAREPGEPCLVLGGGSNVVFTRDVEALVLQTGIGGRALLDEDESYRYVCAGAGENWHDFVQWTLARGWPGLENLALIPGTVGGAPVQNIGAYGLEMAERFHSLDAVSLHDGRGHCFDAADCGFGYRDSVFKGAAAGRYVITAVTFKLPRRWQPRIEYAALAEALHARGIRNPSAQEVADAVIAVRQEKLPDPARLGNAGSFFKNPVVDAEAMARLRRRFPDLPAYPLPDGRHKLAAGWLVEHCGWKGRGLGAVACHDRQALVLVNRGGATGDDVRRLAQAIQHDVSECFGVALEPEPLFV